MSRRSRRKTLSHADLEDFLCDLGENSDYVDSECGEALGHESSTLPNSDAGISEASIVESISDEQRVREFCKVIQSYSAAFDAVANEFYLLSRQNSFSALMLHAS
jgi:hypothetical protein